MDYEILPAHTEAPPNTIRKIANAYIPLFDIARNILITLEKGCPVDVISYPCGK